MQLSAVSECKVRTFAVTLLLEDKDLLSIVRSCRSSIVFTSFVCFGEDVRTAFLPYAHQVGSLQRLAQ